jgi:hypothetical protein
MGRPKGSKNKATVEREAKAAAGRKAVRVRKQQEYKLARAENKKLTRGRKKHFAKPLIQAAPLPQVFAATEQKLDIVMNVAQTIASGVSMMLQLERSKFLDGWRQYIEYMLKADKKPTAETYMQLFAHTVTVLGISAQELATYLPAEDTQEPMVAAVAGGVVTHLEQFDNLTTEANERGYSNDGVSSIDIL